MKNVLKIALVTVLVAQLVACETPTTKDDSSAATGIASATGENLGTNSLATNSVDGENQATTSTEEVK
ncbi:MAG: hypothetical protein K2Q22_09420 [Cytophagales bacterium]|nr:hypothetical protein [Cytophagales bacterium]